MTDNTKKSKDLVRVETMIKIAILAAMGGVLMVILKFPYPAAPYMKVDFGDVPTLIAGFALGPVAGVITVILKVLVNLLLNGTDTAYVGELSNIIVGSTFVFVSAIMYSKKRNFKSAIIGLIVGVLAMTVLATLSNYFFIFPIYGVPVESFQWLAALVVPFNLLKGGLNALVTVLLYKHISNIFKKF